MQTSSSALASSRGCRKQILQCAIRIIIVDICFAAPAGGNAGPGVALSLAGKKLLVVGTGGAGQAVAYYAVQAGARVSGAAVDLSYSNAHTQFVLKY